MLESEMVRNKKAEVETLENKIGRLEEDLEDFYQNAPCCYISFLQSGKIIQVNNTTVEQLGYPKEVLLNDLKMTDLLTVGGKIFYQTHLFPVLKMHGIAKEISIDFIRADASRVSFLVNFKAVIARDNEEVSHIRASLFEITNRKKYETELLQAKNRARQSEEHLRLVMDVVPAIIGYVDSEERYRLVNNAYFQLFGLRPQQIIGRKVKNIVGVETYNNHKPYIKRALQGENVDFESDLTEKSGNKIIVKVSYRPEILDGTVLGFVIYVQDVTEHKRFQQELNKQVKQRTRALEKANEELKRSNLDLEQFAYVASHDLKEPLRMVSNYTQLFAEKYKDLVDDEGKTFLQFASDGVHRMGDLIKDLLEYSRIGRVQNPLQRISVMEIINKVKGNLEVLIAEKNAQILIDKLPIVNFPQLYLEQIFTNLISNALKFTKPGEKPVVKILSERGNEEWIFYVKDNGIGISLEYLEKIFVIFQRLHVKEQYPGTGIGLAICKKIVEQYGGRIWVESEPGDGSTFIFTICDSENGH